jgi:hypothetical protein
MKASVPNVVQMAKSVMESNPLMMERTPFRRLLPTIRMMTTPYFDAISTPAVSDLDMKSQFDDCGMHRALASCELDVILM